MQSLLYSLWFYKTKGVIPAFQFIFLRFPEDPYINKQYTESEIIGFEQYLIYINDHLESFNIKKAMVSLAADKGYPSDGGFSGKTACGYSKYPGHKSEKTGKEYWSCYYKHARDIYYIKDSVGNIKYTTDKIEDIKPEDFNSVTIFKFKGCPAYNKESYDQN